MLRRLAFLVGAAIVLCSLIEAVTRWWGGRVGTVLMLVIGGQP